MRLLFAKTGVDSSDEIKRTLGFIDADFPFKKIKPDVRTATAEFVRTVGSGVYNELLALYDVADPPGDDDEDSILELAQSAIMTSAYKLFAPANDLQHGVNGRKMLKGDDYERPYEHMLVASNDDLERRSFRAMNDFLRLLDEDSIIWKGSPEYLKSHRLIVRTTDDFDRYYVINSLLLLLKLQPGLTLAENNVIVPRVGASAFKLLKEKISGESILPLTDQEQQLLPLIKEACVYYALAWGVIRLQVNLFPDGILQSVRSDRATIKGRVPVVGNQIDQLEQKFKLDCENVLISIENLLKPIEVEPDIISKDTTESDLLGFDSDSNFVST